MYLHDLIKIKYSNEGYLPNYPPHLISDDEMFDAFLYNNISYFHDTYILINQDLSDEYEVLVSAIGYHISRYRESLESDRYNIPDWVYSYMLGVVLHEGSNALDRHFFLEGINCDNNDDEFDSESQEKCYKLSRIYVNKLNVNLRQAIDSDGNVILTRPPSMFPEPHVLKIIRLNGIA